VKFTLKKLKSGPVECLLSQGNFRTAQTHNAPFDAHSGDIIADGISNILFIYRVLKKGRYPGITPVHRITAENVWGKSCSVLKEE